MYIVSQDKTAIYDLDGKGVKYSHFHIKNEYVDQIDHYNFSVTGAGANNEPVFIGKYKDKKTAEAVMKVVIRLIEIGCDDDIIYLPKDDETSVYRFIYWDKDDYGDDTE